jgi:serine O-acetyltransferase
LYVTCDELRLLRLDLRRYFVLLPDATASQRLRAVATTPGIWYVVSYRLGRWVRREVRVPVVREVLKVATFAVHLCLSVVMTMEISFDTEIGGGFYIGHAGYVVINTHAVLGTNCNISPGVVIGEGGRAGQRGTPVIGNNVYIAPGAKIFGGLSIGDNVAIGANAVVNTSVPPGAVVAGNPGRIVSFRGASDFVIVDAGEPVEHMTAQVPL